jgi:hypothetical protein
MWIEGPRSVRLDANLDKRIKITETKEFELRAGCNQCVEHPNFDNPITLDINVPNFGRIQSATGNRQFVLNARVNF